MASIVEGIGNIIYGAVQSIVAVITSVFTTLFSAIQGLLLAVYHTFEGLISTVLNIVGDIVGIITTNIIPIALVVVGIFVAITLSNKKGTTTTKKRA